MRKRLLLAAGTMAGLVGVFLVVLAMLPAGPGVTKANFDRIEKGMTLAEVKEIFGREGKEAPREPGYYWYADDGSVAAVGFDGGCVTEKVWFNTHEPVLDKIRRWVGLAPPPPLPPSPVAPSR